MVLEILDRVLQRRRVRRREHAVLAGMHAEPDARGAGKRPGPRQAALDQRAHRRFLAIHPVPDRMRIGRQHAAVDTQQPFERRPAAYLGDRAASAAILCSTMPIALASAAVRSRRLSAAIVVPIRFRCLSAAVSPIGETYLQQKPTRGVSWDVIVLPTTRRRAAFRLPSLRRRADSGIALTPSRRRSTRRCTKTRPSRRWGCGK